MVSVDLFCAVVNQIGANTVVHFCVSRSFQLSGTEKVLKPPFFTDFVYRRVFDGNQMHTHPQHTHRNKLRLVEASYLDFSLGFHGKLLFLGVFLAWHRQQFSELMGNTAANIEIHSR